MSFLTLNGWTPGPRSGTVSRSEEVIGKDTAAFSGRRLRPRRAIRNLWEATTKVTTRAEQEALRGLLLGLGDHWPLDTSPYFSGKGLVNISAVVADLELAVAPGGGGPVFEAKKFVRAVRPAPATTNIADDRDLQGKTFIVVAAASQADDSTNFINGTGSREITYTASGTTSEVYRDVLAAPAALTNYVAALYVRGNGSTDTIRLTLEEAGGGSGAFVDVALRDGEWQRVENIVLGVGPGAGAVELHVKETVIDSGAVFDLDGVQVEARASSTTFEDSASARAAPSLSYPAAFVAFGNQGLTVNMWTRGPNLADPSGGDNLLALVGDLGGGNLLALAAESATNHIKLVTQVDGVEPADLEHTGLWDGAWHLITGVMRYSASVGTAERELYADGVLVDSDSPGVLPALADIAAGTVFVGNAGGGAPWNGPIEDLSVLPYPAAAAQVLAWASETAQLPDTPTVRAGGEFDPRPSVNVVPILNDQDFIEGAIGGVFHNNSGSTKFRLREDG